MTDNYIFEHIFPNNGMNKTNERIYNKRTTETVRIIIFVFVLVSNTLLTVGILKTNRTLSITNRLFVYLSGIDMLFVPLAIFRKVMKSIEPFWLSAFYGSVDFLLRSNGMLAFLIISILRFYSIYRPFVPVESRTVVTFTVIKVIGTSIISVQIFINFLEGVTLIELANLNIFCGIFVLVVTFMTVICNALSRHILKKAAITTISIQLKSTTSTSYSDTHIEVENPASVVTAEPLEVQDTHFQRKPAQQNTTINLPTPSRSQIKKEKAVRTLNIITFFYCILCLPFSFYILLAGSIYIHNPDNVHVYDGLMMYAEIFSLLGFSNSGVNALIYLLACKKIKKYYRHFFLRMIKLQFNSK
jgi:hypothetical protein